MSKRRRGADRYNGLVLITTGKPKPGEPPPEPVKALDVELYAPAQPPIDTGPGIPHICDNCPNVLDDCYPDTLSFCSIRPA